jgi:hypothetical protein
MVKRLRLIWPFHDRFVKVRAGSAYKNHDDEKSVVVFRPDIVRYALDGRTPARVEHVYVTGVKRIRLVCIQRFPKKTAGLMIEKLNLVFASH